MCFETAKTQKNLEKYTLDGSSNAEFHLENKYSNFKERLSEKYQTFLRVFTF